MSKSLIAAAVALLALAASAAADTIRVPGDHATIQAAVDAAGDGDVIVVSGSHDGGVVISGKTGVTLRATRAVLRPGLADGIVVTNSTRITISKFAFDDVGAAGIRVTDSSDVKVSRCRIDGPAGSGVVVTEGDRVTVERCVIRGPQGNGVEFNAAGTVSPATNCVISRNTVTEPAGFGIQAGGAGLRIVSNVVSGGREHGIEIGAASDRGIVERNRVSNSGDDGIHVHGTSHVVRANTIRTTVGDGINVDGSVHRLERNVVLAAGDDGIELDGDGFTVLLNRVIRPGEDGIDVDGTDSLFERNTVADAVRWGFEVQGVEHTLRFNRTTGSGAGGFTEEQTGATTLQGNTFR